MVRDTYTVGSADAVGYQAHVTKIGNDNRTVRFDGQSLSTADGAVDLTERQNLDRIIAELASLRAAIAQRGLQDPVDETVLKLAEEQLGKKLLRSEESSMERVSRCRLEVYHQISDTLLALFLASNIG